jgi:protein-disulfide isomerase
VDSGAERKRRLALLGGAVALAALVVVVAIFISQGGDDGDTAQPAGGAGGSGDGESAKVSDISKGISQHGVTLGDPEAPATLIEFADLQCPFCAQFATQALPTVIDEYVRDGRLKLQLRLLAFLGPDSERGAEVAAAATLQDRLWPFSELFFENQGPENSGYATYRFLSGLARETPGLDVARVSEDIDSPPANRLVRQAARQAEELGVDGTPSFFLVRGGEAPRPLELSSLDADSFTLALDEALGGG